MVLILLLIPIVAVLTYVRLAPSDPAHWHVPIPAEPPQMGAYLAQVPAEQGRFADLDQIVQALPRTSVLAGSVQQGRMTYITRSAIIGFPDYLTMVQEGEQIMLYARLRFGAYDFGVNEARVRGVLAQAGLL